MPSNSDSEIRHWPVLIASCITTGLTHGLASSMGVFYIEWYTEFPESSALVGWLASSMLAMLLCFSPFAGALTKYFGVRVVVFSGCLLSFSGLLISSFARQFHVLFLTIPFMTGIGFGASYTGSLVMISECFHKHYALANGLCATGDSLGTVIMPVVLRFLIDMYSWRGAIMITSAIQFNVIVCSMVMKIPRKQKQKPIKDSQTIQMAPASGEQDNNRQPVQSENADVNMYAMARSSTSHVHLVMDCGPGLPEVMDAEGETQGYGCSRGTHSFLNHTGISLFWTNRVFTLFLVNVLFVSPIFGVTLTYLPAHAELVGIPKVNASLLISVIGISGIVSRLTHGRLVDANVIQPAYIYGFFLALTAIGAPIIAAIDNYAGLVTCSVLIGLSAGGFIPLQAVLIRKIVGQDRFPGGFGIGLMVVAIGNMITSYIGGYAFDVTNSYSWDFYAVGVFGGLSLVIVLGTHLLWTKLVNDYRWPTVIKPTPIPVIT